MDITKLELQAKLQTCYMLNEKVRQRYSEYFRFFICALLVCITLLPASLIIGFMSASSTTAIGFLIVLSIVDFIIIATSLYLVIDSAIEIKKCNKIDQELQEKEALLKQDI